MARLENVPDKQYKDLWETCGKVLEASHSCHEVQVLSGKTSKEADVACEPLYEDMRRCLASVFCRKELSAVQEVEAAVGSAPTPLLQAMEDCTQREFGLCLLRMGSMPDTPVHAS
mmetsp:Transcript_1946/g.6994  ORF Transcript_1946/g.6994 Transcript_1946/m.6994 type:complete len:115 (+) Transcript_1946:26-370(+)